MLYSCPSIIATRGSSVEYKIKLITPAGVYDIYCGSDETILDAAETKGIDLPYSSRCGADATSGAKLISGKVYLDGNSFLSDEEIAAGYILTDIAYPQEDCVIETHKEDELLDNHELPEVTVNADYIDWGIDWEELASIDWGSLSGGGGSGNGEGSGDGDSDTGPYTEYKKLTDDEKDFVKKHPVVASDFFKNAKAASQIAIKYCKGIGAHNGITDAFRHMLWCAYNCYDHGYKLAKAYGDAHETTPGQDPAEKDMDLFNNELGYTIGLNALDWGVSRDFLPDLVYSYIKAGKAKTLK